MSVLLVFSSSQLGGTERSLTRMVHASEDKRYILSTLDGEGPWTQLVRSINMTPVVFGTTVNGKRHGWRGVKPLIRLILFIRKHKIKYLYVCGFRAAFIIRFFRPLFPGVKIVQGVRWNPASKSLLDKIFRKLEYLTNGLIDIYITNSQAAAYTLVTVCGVSPRKVKVIYNGIENFSDFTIAKSCADKEVLTIANINERKGHQEYLQAISRVLKVVPDVKFVFVGRDDIGERFHYNIAESGLGNSIRFEGFQDDVSPYYQCAKVFVLPSLWGEGCPTSILESMAFSVPVVAYGIDGIPELIEEGVDGYVVPVYDFVELADRITALLLDEEMNKRFGVSGQKKVTQKFSMKNCICKHNNIFY